MKAVKESLAFYGTVVHSLSSEQPFVILHNAVIVIKDGRIHSIKQGIALDEALAISDRCNVKETSIKILQHGEFLMPGFVDTHIHAPQYVNCGVGYELTLLDWLSKYTFLCEAKFSDTKHARNVYRKVVRRTLQNGTTTASYFATIHLEGSLVLAELMQEFGQRGFVGKVNMDNNSPEFYCETTERSIEDTRVFIERMMETYGRNGLVSPCITPRFAISCTPKLMKSLGELSREYNIPIQTHMSENVDEIKFVREAFESDEYVHVYEAAGLLTNKTILAHCVHSSDEELRMIKQYECGISHCANSNIQVQSGAMDLRKMEKHGVKVGLGTDISGGYSVSILDSMRKAVEVSKLIKISQEVAYSNIDIYNAFFLATLGGARVMNLDDKIGNFLIGKEFDALVVSTLKPEGPFDVFESNGPDDLILKFLYCGDDRNITDIYVAGQKIIL